MMEHQMWKVQPSRSELSTLRIDAISSLIMAVLNGSSHGMLAVPIRGLWVYLLLPWLPQAPAIGMCQRVGSAALKQITEHPIPSRHVCNIPTSHSQAVLAGRQKGWKEQLRCEEETPQQGLLC